MECYAGLARPLLRDRSRPYDSAHLFPRREPAGLIVEEAFLKE
jgi:hypothetical protein